MTERGILLVVAVVAFTLGVGAIGLMARAALLRGRTGQRRVWLGLILQGACFFWHLVIGGLGRVPSVWRLEQGTGGSVTEAVTRGNVDPTVGPKSPSDLTL